MQQGSGPGFDLVTGRRLNLPKLCLNAAAPARMRPRANLWTPPSLGVLLCRWGLQCLRTNAWRVRWGRGCYWEGRNQWSGMHLLDLSHSQTPDHRQKHFGKGSLACGCEEREQTLDCAVGSTLVGGKGFLRSQLCIFELQEECLLSWEWLSG